MAQRLGYHDEIYTQPAYVLTGSPSCVYSGTPRSYRTDNSTLVDILSNHGIHYPTPAHHDVLTDVDPWEQHKPLLEKLWLDDDLELEQIRGKMQREFRFKRTLRQYKTRFITVWGWRKNIKLEEALFIMRLKIERERAGRRSIFRLRGRLVNTDDLKRYLRRKRIDDVVRSANEKQVESPDTLECYDPPDSPPPSPPMDPEDIESLNPSELGSQDLAMTSPNLSRCQSLFGQTSQLASIATFVTDQSPQDFDHGSGAVVTATPASSASHFPILRRRNGTNPRRQAFGAIQPHMFSISRSPSASRTPDLSNLERVVFNVNAFLRGTYDSGSFAPSSAWNLVKSQQPGVNLDHFESLWFSGFRLNLEGLHGPEIKIFDEVFRRAGELLQNGDPRAMKYMLDMLIHIAHDLPEIDTHMRDYLACMAQRVLPHNHPWRLIMMAIVGMDKVTLKYALLEAWRVANGVYKERLGCFDQQYLSSYPDYLASLGYDQSSEAALYQLLQALMAQCGRFDSRVLNLRLKYTWTVLDGDNKAEALKLFSDLLRDTSFVGNDVVRLRCLESIAGCYYQFGRSAEAGCGNAAAGGDYAAAESHNAAAQLYFAAAEHYQSEAILLSQTRKWIENMLRTKTRLYGWLKKERRDKEAGLLLHEINQLTGISDYP
ncbi:hypothetical protein P154DRAFT_583566 [Amniculicola lignicola CBS 123094]|uniref:Clr5 domain-containing protein n=1 Tax=Amniculicola lignicola CBS 123094 TaxID=1392246 RepID=A0A6A5W509_9PLEO|nr:hypothetical protein P154DRAFT_583566 [Amniculicola lignicola CBS 123094]